MTSTHLTIVRSFVDISQQRCLSAGTRQRHLGLPLVPVRWKVARHDVKSAFGVRRPRTRLALSSAFPDLASQNAFSYQDADEDEEEVVETFEAMPEGMRSYETLVILRPTLTEDEMNAELDALEGLMNEEGCVNVRLDLRLLQPLAYPVKRFTAGTFALYRYWAPPRASQKVANFLSQPEAGKEMTVLRHMTVKD